MANYDCILIPGGGLLEDGSLPAWTRSRLDLALELQHETNWIATLSGGTVHKPPPHDASDFPVFESKAAADYLIRCGTNPSMILHETCSYDTIGNAYFSRLLFAEPLSWKTLLVITSDFHLARVQTAFDWIYQLTPLPVNYHLQYTGVPDLGLSATALEARIQRESESLTKLQQTRLQITSLAAMSAWIYTEHAAYAPGSESSPLSSDLLSTY
jgi:hypothetical protein